jgi:hypothetical protein
MCIFDAFIVFLPLSNFTLFFYVFVSFFVQVSIRRFARSGSSFRRMIYAYIHFNAEMLACMYTKMHAYIPTSTSRPQQ